jgi:metal-dependent amidase/aminoacylase/carboxypeptidase family protein
MAGHAGTVPMGLRRDALAAAAECVVAVERIAGSMPDVVGTVGRIEARPGAMNVIPGKAQFSLDVRAPTDDKRHAAIAAIRAEFAAIAQRRNVDLAVTPLWEAKTSPCAPAMQEQIATAIHAEGIRVHRLPSGAGHDGMAIIDIAPIGMLFVRCKGGISPQSRRGRDARRRRHRSACVRALHPRLHAAIAVPVTITELTMMSTERPPFPRRRGPGGARRKSPGRSRMRARLRGNDRDLAAHCSNPRQ